MSEFFDKDLDIILEGYHQVRPDKPYVPNKIKRIRKKGKLMINECGKLVLMDVYHE